jgi:uncharacterized membrane protein HdeD (DUF308 family)
MVMDDRHGLREVLARERSNWGWVVALGALILICGIFILGNLLAATIFSMVLVATFMIFGGMFRLMLAFRARTWRRFTIWALAGVFYLAAGAAILVNPLLASTLFTFMIAALLVFAGGMRIWLGFEARPSAGWIWMIASGVVTLLTGLVIAAGWPFNSLWVIGLFLGIELIIEGAGFIALGLGLRAKRAD